MNDEQDVRRLFEAAVRHEPPLTLDREAVIGAGRRRLRVRRTAAVGGAATAVAAVVIGMTALSGSQFGMPEPVGPAGPGVSSEPRSAVTTTPASPSARVRTTVEAPRSTVWPTTTTWAEVPSTTMTHRPEVSEQLGVALGAAPLSWPADVEVEGSDVPWHTFDAKGHAQFALVTRDHARRTIEIRVAAGQRSGDKPEGCFQADMTCRSHRTANGALVHYWQPERVQEHGPNALTLHALRPDGVVVVVADIGGAGPPWRTEPLMSVDGLEQIALIPGFAAVNQ
ncbi:hypothetical protein [Actinokineospora sp. UTMC 2448]|uniref:hypothetical protein n=1 Tax=Actinokineospora sp. UTMC 2448 TaxID=2268449 RepID=UPI0021643F23|nr:hypothetical protein [Actinokineospora sp. UTMC 2448]UVS82486.1 hypothetical protein Actkin_06259 [Actinokineospora sp. UTMC 2448]